MPDQARKQKQAVLQGPNFGLPFPVQVNLPFDRIELYGPKLAGLSAWPEIGLPGPVLDSTPDEVFRSWAEQFKEASVTVHGPFMDLAPGGMDPAVVELTRKRLLQALGPARLFKAGEINFHAGYDHDRYPHNLDRFFEESARTWETVLEATEAWGPLILLENVYEQDPETMVRVLEKVNHPRLRACLDTGHQNYWGRAPLTEWLEALAPWLSRLHLHDNDGTFDLHQPVGAGSFDFKLLFGWLEKRGLRPEITLEPHTEEDFVLTLAGLRGIVGCGAG